jgi:hypothetical protein
MRQVVMIGCLTYYRSYNVGVSHVALQYTKVKLACLACADMASEHDRLKDLA